MESPARTESAVAHFDVAGPEGKPLHDFYRATFGWAVDEQGPGYALVSTPAGGPDGAIVEADEPSVTLGIAVDSLDAALAAAVAAGGNVVMPVTDNGWVVKAQVTDPAGNRLTLIAR